MLHEHNLQAVARRKNLPKFGMSKEDRPGPNPQTTIVAEDVFMQFIAGKVSYVSPYLFDNLQSFYRPSHFK